MVEFQAIVQHLTQFTLQPTVLATLVSVEGSSYRRAGARLLLTAEGKRIGSISGGCLEEDLLARARQIMSRGTPELVTYDTTSENDLVWGVGLGCNGVVRVLIESLPTAPRWTSIAAARMRAHRPTNLSVVWRSDDSSLLGTHLTEELPPVSANAGVFLDNVAPPTRLIVLGAGDDARPLVKFTKDLGWHVTVGDPRPAFATKDRFPEADERVVAPAAELIRVINPPSDALAVIMTHHYVHDVPLLRDILPRSLSYVGLLGPKKRAAKILADLRTQGHSFTNSQIDRLHAPVGLDLGAETPEEVALSIVSEMRATLSGRDARPLRERERPIHEDSAQKI